MTYQATAAAAFEQLQKADATSPYVSALVADTRVQRRQFRSGFFFYNEAAKQLPNLHGIHASLADVYRKTGHSDWAAEEDAKERALPPADCKAHPAECQFAGGHDLQILTQPRRGTVSPEALYWRAKAANELAMQALFRLGQLPPSAELHQLRAEIARGQGQHLESAREWREALALMPGNPRLRRELADSLFMAQDYRAALAEVESLLQGRSEIAGAELHRRRQPAATRRAREGDTVSQDRARRRPRIAGGRRFPRPGALAIGQSRRGRPPPGEGPPTRRRWQPVLSAWAAPIRPSGQREKAAGAMAKYQEILKKAEEQKEEVAREAQIGPPAMTRAN